MRADIIWPVVWGACFIGGVVLGSTGPVNVVAFGSSSPKLRGSEHVVSEVSENVAEKRQLQLQLQQDEGALAEARNVAAAADAAKPATAPTTTTTTTTRALASSEIDAGYGGDHQFETGAIDSVFGGRSTVAQRVHALNAGLWGPNEEEEKEIEMELARLREEAFKAPATPSSEGDRFELPPSRHDPYSFDFEAGGTSYSYDYGYEPLS